MLVGWLLELKSRSKEGLLGAQLSVLPAGHLLGPLLAQDP
jgi:hypothetical protein